MGNSIQVLAKQFFDKSSVEECSLDELRHIAKRHPYFAPVQFLLVHKLKGAPEEMEKQKAKAVLFYPDPLVFEAFMAEDHFNNGQQPVVEDAQKDISADTFSGDTLTDQDTISEVSEAAHKVGEFAATDNTIETVADDSIKGIQSAEAAPEIIPIEEAEVPVIAITEPEVSDVVEEEAPVVVETKAEVAKLSPADDKPLPELAFEPFHTVDYFASQGIKMSLDDGAKDKLGKGLKSFTEWLRTMKRLPVNQLPIENMAEKKVENMASHSVADSTVVTEAMAEVWAKQGNREKALDIYNKLSLLHPSKKVYFAAKIDQLKTS